MLENQKRPAEGFVDLFNSFVIKTFNFLVTNNNSKEMCSPAEYPRCNAKPRVQNGTDVEGVRSDLVGELKR